MMTPRLCRTDEVVRWRAVDFGSKGVDDVYRFMRTPGGGFNQNHAGDRLKLARWALIAGLAGRSAQRAAKQADG
jgi:hypothetical protein